MLVLGIAKEKDSYVYEMIKRISSQGEITEGTVYPLMRRLTKEGNFTTYLVESDEGPPRKYYRLTDKGHHYFEKLEMEWLQFVNKVDDIINIAAPK